MLRSKSSKKPNPPNLKNLRQVPSTRTSITRDKNIPTNPSFDKLDLPTRALTSWTYPPIYIVHNLIRAGSRILNFSRSGSLLNLNIRVCLFLYFKNIFLINFFIILNYFDVKIKF